MICFAILAHTKEEVLQDQIANVEFYNPNSRVVLYNGGRNPDFGKATGVDICRYSRPLSRGRLGRFLYETMVWLKEMKYDYDYLVSLDSDAMFVRKGYESFLDNALHQYDCMGINMGVQMSREEVPHWYPGQTMWAEWEKWQPFFGTDFLAGCLNCLQVYKREIVDAMIENVDSQKLEGLFETTEVFALEEMLCPTLAVRVGARYRPYPVETAEYIKLDSPYTEDDVAEALGQPRAFCIHPVERSIRDPARSMLRDMRSSSSASPRSLTIIWGAFQGGVETAISNRLRAVNGITSDSHHTYFYYEGVGIERFEGIPHSVSRHSDDLILYIREFDFQVITFVNTLHNLKEVHESGFAGLCLFEFHGFAQSILEEINRINEGQDYGLIRAVVVPGHYVAAIAKSALWKRPDIELFVALNTVDTHQFQNYPSSPDVFHQLNVPPQWAGYPFVGWIGRLEKDKNWRLLLQIFTVLQTNNPKIKLIIAGDTLQSSELNEFFNEVQKQNLTQHVRLLSNLPHSKMPLYYSLIGNSGGVLLSTSLTEGYPYHLLEAQACGCPVISTNAGGAVEAVTHGSTGFTYIQDVQDAVRWTEHMMKDTELRSRVVRQGRDKVRAVNGIATNASKYAAWLSTLKR